MHRFFVDPVQIVGGEIFIRDAGDLKHLRRVLRLSVGDAVDVSDGADWEYRGVISQITEAEVVVQITDKQKFAREPRLRVSLFQGIPKAAKMEGIVRRSVELGVYEIIPVFMARTVVVDKGNFEKKVLRWQKISDEAVKQCKRGMIPRVQPALTFAGLPAALADFDLVLFPYENEENRTIKACLRSLSEGQKRPQTVAMIIGPEGGFSEEEAEILDRAGAVRVSLGRTILRTETAGPAALAMTMYELEM